MKLLSLFSFSNTLSAVKNFKVRKAGNRIFFIFLIMLIAISFTSCKSYDTKFKTAQDTILYAVRTDALFSYRDTVHFYLNGKKITEIKRDSYVAVHLKPGKYSVRYKVTASDGKVLMDKDYGPHVFKPGVAYGSAVIFAFFWHPPFDFYDTDIQGAKRVSPNLQEEIDLRNKVKPQ
ncbi:MAG TPA: hypothetical protein PK358_17405 [Spirochaetota bacterium]|nr:hypothetical protein [Spirochaetota bacterium]HPJ36618.1 hypothetical protein [Spirochaetota bacterium]